MSRSSAAAVLVLLGLVLAVPAAGLLLLAAAGGQAAGRDPALAFLSLSALIAGGLGAFLFTAGVAAYVFAPGRGAARDHAGYATILGCLYLAAVGGITASGLYVLVATVAGGAGIGGAELLTTRGQLRTPTFLILAALAQELAFLSILYFRVVRPGLITWQDMGLAARKLLSRLALGLPTAVALLTVIGTIAYLLSLLGVEQTQEREFAVLRDASVPQFIALLLIVGPLTGLAEESFFRGYVFQSLYRKHGPLHAYLASAAIFAGAHLDWRAFLPLFAAGWLLALVYRRSGSIVPGVVAHAINNSVTLAVFYFRMA